MRVRDLSPAELTARLRGAGVVLNTGAFRLQLRSDDATLAKTLALAYAAHEVETETVVHHMRVQIARGAWRGPGRDRGVTALINGEPVIGPFPSYLGFPMLESILNWCIAKQVLRYVVFHAGAAERDGRALILTGQSGSGKSTLCAALSRTGWRLVSDELMLLRPAPAKTGRPELVANPRPISLKNESIASLRGVAPDARFTPSYEGTIRGTISFLCPLAAAVERAGEPARPGGVIFPTFAAGAGAEIEEMQKAQGFMRLIENSVNYAATLRKGFEAVADLTEACRFYDLRFGDTESALRAIDSVWARDPGGAAAA